MAKTIELKTIKGFISFEDVKKEIIKMGELIGSTEYDPEELLTSVIVMNTRCESMRSLLSLYELYIEQLSKQNK